jgi:hypothetical protein
VPTTGLIIIGVNRSGTSAVAAALRALGVYFGKDEDLKTGGARLDYEHYENRRVEEISSSLQAEFSIKGLPFRSLPTDWQTYPDISDEILAIRAFVAEYYATHPVWGWKDPRVTLLTPIFEEAFASSEFKVDYLLPIRHPAEISRGISKRQGISMLEAFGYVTHFWLTAFTEVETSRLHLVPYESLTLDPRSVLEPAWTSLGLPRPTETQWKAVRDQVKTSNQGDPQETIPGITDRVWNLALKGIEHGAESVRTEMFLLRREWEESMEITRLPQSFAERLQWRVAGHSGTVHVFGERTWTPVVINVPPNHGAVLELSFSAIFGTVYLRNLSVSPAEQDLLKPKAGSGAFVDHGTNGRMRVLPFARGVHCFIPIQNGQNGFRLSFEMQLEVSYAAIHRVASRLASR